MKQISEYGVERLVEGFEESIKQVEATKEKFPILKDWCEGRIEGYKEAIHRIKFWSMEVEA